MRNYKLERLQNGETFITSEKGNSMVPLIHSGQNHIIEPTTIDDVEVGDIVYCKVKGRVFTHLVKAKSPEKGCLIGNNKGGINGWTRNIYGKVIEVL
jgi:phage repressor protein C with HTH and peptisase S24 domain